MRRALLFFAFSLTLDLAAGARDPQIYRWKDKAGKEHVTNTPPPADAVPLDVPPLENTKEPDHAATPTPRAPKPVHAPPRPLSPAQEAAWRALEQRLTEARSRGDVQALENAADGILSDALWGGGVWALTLLPIATLALVTLLGWWAGSGLRRPLALSVTLLFSLVGLALAQLCLGQFVFRAQSQRLRVAVTALKSHFGVPQGPAPENLRRLEAQLSVVEASNQLLAPPWRFPQEVRALGDLVRQVVVNP